MVMTPVLPNGTTRSSGWILSSVHGRFKTETDSSISGKTTLKGTKEGEKATAEGDLETAADNHKKESDLLQAPLQPDRRGARTRTCFLSFAPFILLGGPAAVGHHKCYCSLSFYLFHPFPLAS